MSTTVDGVRIVDMPDLGAFNSTSSLVGERAGSGRFSASGLSSYFLSVGPVNLASTGQIYQNEGATINRFNDRVWVGGATVSDGNNPFTSPGNITKDWLSVLQAAIGLNPTSEAVFASMQSPASPNGVGLGVLGAAQSLHFTNPAQAAIGIAGYAYNNSTTLATTGAWSFYGESYRSNNTVGNTYGAELAIIEQGVSHHLTPYIGAAPGFTIGLQLDSGNGFNTTAQPGLTSASAGLVFSQNTTDSSAPFQTGIVFYSTALKRTAGIGEAISLASGHALQWYNSAGSATSGIVGTTTTINGSTDVVLSEGLLEIGMAATGTPIATFNILANAVNYISVNPNIAGKAPIIAAAGADTNVDLVLAVKGVGGVQSNAPVLPFVDNAYQLGATGNRWTAVWAANGAIQTSDASLKTDVASLPSTLAIVAAVNPVTFKWIHGGSKPIVSQVQVEEDVYETVTETVDDHEVQPNGSVHLVSRTVTRRRQVFDELPVTLPDGTPVVDQVLVNRRGQATTYVPRPRMHSVARKQRVMTDKVSYVEQPGQRTHWGFMASDVKAAMDTVPLDFGGYVKDEHGIEHLRPDQLIPVLWRAVQELAAQVAALRAPA